MTPRSNQRFTAHFIGLVVVGYLIGLITVAWAVWLVSRPILEDMTRDALQNLAHAEAVALSVELDAFMDEVVYLASADAIKEVTTGNDNFATTAEDRIGDLLEDPSVVAVSVYDFSGARILHAENFSSWLSLPLYAAGAEILATGILSENLIADGPVARLFSHGTSDELHVGLAQPVIARGFLEGVVIIELRHNLSGLLRPTTRVEGQGFISTYRVSGDADLLRETVGNTSLVLAGSGSATTTAQTGRTLVRSVLAAVVVVLAVPFLAILGMGYRVLVEPQRQLLASQQELTRQSMELAELASIVRAFHEAILTTDAEQRILWVNPAFERISGYPQSEVLGRRLSDFLEFGEENDAALAELELSYQTAATVRSELLYRRSDGTPVWVSASVTPVLDEDGDVLRFAMIMSDISTNKAYEEELRRTQEETRYRSLHDALTGLPNRRYFDEMVAPLMDSPVLDRCLVRIDLDFFKAVNDSFGHAAGDHVLCVVADIMREHCEEDDFPARVGGDEFLIFMAAGKTEADADQLCHRLRSEIQRDIPFESSVLRVGASFGIASSAVSFVDPKEILVSADAALYKSKDDGRNRITLYTPELHSSVQEARRLAIELEIAIEQEDFEPWFQPQFDAVTGALVGVEALARWNHPKHGILQPWRFMPNIEKLSLTEEMDSIIYRKGLQTLERLNKAGLAIPRMSFNVSNRQIENPVLGSIADGFDLGGAQITLEILESVVVEEMSDEKLGNLFALRELGFGLELDDFGSGHASIAGLLKLRPDVIKIDKMLVQPVVESTVAQELIASIVDIGRALGVYVTAEGAETREHVDILRGCGCKYLQGYYMSRPIPADTLAERIRTGGFPDISGEDWSIDQFDEPARKDTA